jgi:Fe-S-cluster-containing dehydrogenase component/CRP-like cAMP-binding protein
MPELEITIQRPQRWDEPFGAAMNDADVDGLLRVEPFRMIDTGAFPPSLPLRGILRNDTRLQRYQPGDLIVREGDYGNSAFVILAGNVRVLLERLDPKLLGRSDVQRRSWWGAIAQLWTSPAVPEARRLVDSGSSQSDRLNTRQEDDATRVFLQDVPRLLDRTGSVQLGAGEIFGELAALTRAPRTATVIAETAATLVEIRWQGLRDIMRRTPAIRQHIERLYRENSLLVHLRETSLLANLPETAMERVLAATLFESYGNFDWYADFGKLRQSDPAEQLAAEPLIAAEGDQPNGLLLVRSGFARLTRRYGHGEKTLAYLGKGQVFGIDELAAAAESGDSVGWRHSLRAVGYVDLLRIPTEVFHEVIWPELGQERREQVRAARPANASDNGVEAHCQTERPRSDPHMLDFLADHRILNGTQTMLINLDRCTRCDDCVRACAATHDNNPRFVRQGLQHDRLMVANACMQCVDPVCMIGCPTGAIARDAATGTVRINDRTCIGCATCANSCPYNAIRMVETRAEDGAFLLDDASQQPILKATKCDFCAGQLTGPACQHACPHNALIRFDMTDISGLANWLDG